MTSGASSNGPLVAESAQVLMRFAKVRFQGQTGNILLNQSITGYDPISDIRSQVLLWCTTGLMMW